MTVSTLRSGNAELPRPGQRLVISVLAADFGLSESQMAEAAGLSRQALFGVIAENAWPAHEDAPQIREALHKLFASKGATPEQLATLFHAHVTRRRLSAAGTQAPTPAKQIEEVRPNMFMPKQTPHAPARRAFKLLFNPFDAEVTSEAQMFLSAEIAYVGEACYQTATGCRFVAVVSESGGGKTTTLANLEARIRRENKPVQFIRPWVLGMEDNDTRGKTLKSADILASIITTLDPQAIVPLTLQARGNRARDLLTSSATSGMNNLLVIEEAHCLPDATLKHLKRLHEMRLGLRPLLGILLVGQTELAARLDPRRAALREVTQRCEVVHLLPLDDDLKGYLAHRVKCMERSLDEFIDQGGVDEIRTRLTVVRPGANGKGQAVSLAYPLAVNNLMTACLNAAADIGAAVITKDVVRAV